MTKPQLSRSGALIEKLRRASVAVYAGVDEGPARAISELLNEAALALEGRASILTYSDEELCEMHRAVSELAMAMGNPCVMAEDDKTIESETIRLAAQRLAAARSEIETPSSPSLRLLLDQVRREWYRLTGYSQLKADIDYALDSANRQIVDTREPK
jgi:hypothetical protein